MGILQLHYRQFLVAHVFADVPSLYIYPPSFHEMIFILVYYISHPYIIFDRRGVIMH